METIEEKARQFAFPFYEEKDSLHDWRHIQRVLELSLKLGEKYSADRGVITLGTYFHGIIFWHEDIIRQYLASQEYDRVEQVIQVAKESLKEVVPQSIEGKIVHDAHLLEGGGAFRIIKSLVTGTQRGSGWEQTMEYMKKQLLGRFQCYLPETRPVYEKMEQFMRNFIDDYEKGLNREWD